MKSNRFKLILLAGTLLAAPLTQADELDFFRELLFEAKTGTSLGAFQSVPASIRHGGKISKSSLSAEAGVFHLNPSETYISILELGFARVNYHFSDVPAPFSAVDKASFFTWQEYVYDHSQGRAVAGTASLELNAADTTAFSHGLTFTLGLGAKQYFSRDEFVWLGAVTIYSPLRERMYYLPALVVNWNLADNLKLNVSNGVELIWKIDKEERWQFSCKASYELGAFQIEKRAGWQTNWIPVDFKLEYYLTKRFYVAGTISVLAWQRYRRWERGYEQDATEFTTDPTIAFAIKSGFKF